ncbi:MAG TPA: hypothetical protein VFE23_16905 [Usitatibacter sp.]|jgi:type I restriction enzyme S subunit|nr:hypothetical protein [Usitatibacter sp.]
MSPVRAYRYYKQSDIQCVGQIPTHWSVVALRRITKSYCDGPFGSGLKTEHYTEQGVRVVRLQNVRAGYFSNEDAAYIDTAYFQSQLSGHNVVAGDVLIAGLGDETNLVGRACVAPPNLGLAVVKADCFRFRLDDSLADPSFVALQLSASAESDAGRLATGTTRSRISLATMAGRRLAIPPVDEQRVISAFVLREVTLIEELISQQEVLIALLSEKVQALISNAVTQGLNPSLPTRAAGIGWIGSVPRHWNPTPLMWLTDASRPIMYGIVLPGPNVEVGVPIVKGGNVRPSRLNLESMARTTPEIEAPFARARLQGGDLVYAIRGSIGDCEIVPEDLSGANITQDVARVSPARDTCGRWLRWVLVSKAVRESLACKSAGAAVRGINICDLKRAVLMTPPLNEQLQIAEYLDAETAKLNALLNEATTAISLLEERRKCLMWAAITGQIDVRGRSPQAATPSAAPQSPPSVELSAP